jgi:2-polyprenyl-3-methyl-5-hydroxy-6-metoxy-1,4-benzoquinol methylase
MRHGDLMFYELKHTPYAEEMMDGTTLSIEELLLVESALDRINFLSGSFFRVAEWLADQYKVHHNSSREEFTFLDIGCGGGGLLRYLADFAFKKALSIKFFGVDTNSKLISIAQLKSKDKHFIEYSSERLETTIRSYSLIYSNLVLHHIAPEEIDAFLTLTKQRAKIATRHEDIARSIPGLLLAKIIPHLVTTSPIVHHDAVVSVYRSYSKSEWQDKALSCGYNCMQTFPQRVLLQT